MTKGLPRKATEEQILKLCETDKDLEKLWFDELKAGEKEKQAYKQYLDALHEVDARALGTLSGPVLRWRRSSADCRLGDRGQAPRGANDPSIPPVAPAWKPKGPVLRHSSSRRLVILRDADDVDVDLLEPFDIHPCGLKKIGQGAEGPVREVERALARNPA